MQLRPGLTHSNANVMPVVTQISELVFVLFSIFHFIVLLKSSNGSKNKIINHDSEVLAGAWTNPAQLEIDTTKPELSSD